MPEVTRTVVSCPHCHESFSLSPENSIELLKKLEIEVECPACLRPAHISALTKARQTPPVRQRPVPVKAAVPEMASPPTRVGLPPFKPLGSDASAAFGSASGAGIPFEPIKPGSKSQKGSVSHSAVPKKGVVAWWSRQSRLTQGLLAAFILLVPGLLATVVLLANHIVEHHRQFNEAIREAEQNKKIEMEMAPKGTDSEGKLNVPVIPSKAVSQPSSPVSRN